MQKIILLVAFVAFVAAQYNPQQVTVTSLTNGVATVGTLLPTATSNNVYHVNVYSIFVPMNATSYNVTLTNSDTTSCSYVTYESKSDGAPCSSYDYDSDYFYCSNAYISYSNINNYNYPGQSSSSLYEYKVGDYLYLAVGKYYSSDYDETCTYSLTVTMNGYCPNGQISIASDFSSSSSTQCASYTPVTSTGSQSFNLSSAGATNFFSLYVANVALETGMITVNANFTTGSIDITGRQYSPYYSSYYDCRTTSGSSQSNGYYTYSLVCYVPRSGLFVFAVEEDSQFNGTITFTFANCPAGMGGFNCSYPNTPFNLTALATAPMVVNVPYVSNTLSYAMSIFYIDISPSFVGNDMIFQFTSTGSGYICVRPNGYPEENYYEDSDEVQSISSGSIIYWGLTQFDYVQRQTRYYFAVLCSDSTNRACNITIGFNSSSTQTSASSGGSTTGITTGVTPVTTGITTGTTTGVTTGITTRGITTATTTSVASTTNGVTTRGATTAGATTSTPAQVTTAAEKSGLEIIVPSIVLLLVALLI